MISIRKRGQLYQYSFEISKVDGKRKRACYTGLRTGEVFALTWDDIDFESKIIKVKHNVYAKNKDNKGKWYIGDTKLKILEGYKQRQTINKKRCGTDYYSHYLEKVTNKYGKITEYKIIEVKGKARLSNKINSLIKK